MAQHHMAFPGSITFQPSTLIRVVEEYVTSLARHGFRRFFFINGHGGNIATLGAAFSETYANQARLHGDNAPDLRCTLKNWYMSPAVKTLREELFGDKEGSHAAPSEISLAYYAYPEAVRSGPLPPIPKERQDFTGPADFRRRYPDGRMCSDPSGASAEHGKRLYDTAVDALTEDYRAFLAAE
jgi:creatinine amidohydrolase